MATVAGLVRNGVCYALWDPEGFDPFDPRQWFTTDPEADEIEGLAVPTFVIRLGQNWAIATPPGRRLDRIALEGEVDREVLALLSDGSYARFSGRAGLQELDGGDGGREGLHVKRDLVSLGGHTNQLFSLARYFSPDGCATILEMNPALVRELLDGGE